MTGPLSCVPWKRTRQSAAISNLYGDALNGRSKTALNSTVVRLYHSRPVSFRCRFQNARSVLRYLHTSAAFLIRSAERKSSRLSGIGKPVIWLDTIPLHECKAARRAMSAQHPAWCPIKHPGIRRATAAQCPSSCRETSHATPVNVRAAVGATARKRPAISPQQPHDDRGVSARCPRKVRKRGHLIAASAASPRQRPQFVRVRAQSSSATWPQTCPCPVRRRTVSGIMSSPCPRTIRFQNHSADNLGSRPIGVHATSAQRPRSHRWTLTCTHSFRRKAAGADQPMGGWARESRFDGRSPGGASMSCSPVCPLRSTLTRRPAPGLLRLGFRAGRTAGDKINQLLPAGIRRRKLWSKILSRNVAGQ